jgi:hypothetical protein
VCQLEGEDRLGRVAEQFVNKREKIVWEWRC